MEFVFTKFPGKRAAAEVAFTNEEMYDDQRGVDSKLIFKKCHHKAEKQCIKYLLIKYARNHLEASGTK